MSFWPSAGFRRSFRLSRRDKKTNKAMYESKKSEMYDMADVPTYEEVTLYRRQDGAKHRLVVFVGEHKVRLWKWLSICHWVPLSVFSSHFAGKAEVCFIYRRHSKDLLFVSLNYSPFYGKLQNTEMPLLTMFRKVRITCLSLSRPYGCWLEWTQEEAVDLRPSALQRDHPT